MTDLKWNISKIISYIRSNAGFRALLVNADDSIMDEVYTFADNGCGSCKKTILTFIDVNEKVTKLVGYSKNDFIGKKLDETKIFTKESLGKNLDSFFKRMKGEDVI